MPRPVLARLAVVACALTATVVAAATAAAQTVQVRLLETDPVGGTPLFEGEALYVRLAYTSDVPVRFRARGWGAGREERDAATNIMPAYPAGTGETLVWLAYRTPMRLDQLRIAISDESGTVIADTAVAVEAEWRAGRAPAARARAAWVAALNEEQQQMGRAAGAAAAASTGGDGAVDALLGIMALSLVGYPVLQVYVWRRWRGRWRAAGLLPVAGSIPIVVITLLALADGSNLWPLLMLFTFPLGLLYLVGLVVVRAFLERS